MDLNRYAKAVVGAVVAALSAYQVAQADNVITQQEWVTVAVAFFTALGLVWGVPNSPAKRTTSTAPAADDTVVDVPIQPVNSGPGDTVA